uniref:Uncharacterized protein n=1 Tax=Branchiostoma floridae TaxID=7739 RepID=C3Z0J2_BRAFL|eukprot:XP_002598028.1 hypothetical protein BRAFLDRAFT_79746 [Branchiostoma floridae]
MAVSSRHVRKRMEALNKMAAGRVQVLLKSIEKNIEIQKHKTRRFKEKLHEELVDMKASQVAFSMHNVGTEDGSRDTTKFNPVENESVRYARLVDKELETVKVLLSSVNIRRKKQAKLLKKCRDKNNRLINRKMTTRQIYKTYFPHIPREDTPKAEVEEESDEDEGTKVFQPPTILTLPTLPRGRLIPIMTPESPQKKGRRKERKEKKEKKEKKKKDPDSDDEAKSIPPTRETDDGGFGFF